MSCSKIISIISLVAIYCTFSLTTISTLPMCQNYQSTDEILQKINLKQTCNYFLNKNLVQSDLSSVYNQNLRTDVSFISSANSANRTDCCQICLEKVSCYLFRYSHSSSTCDMFSVTNSFDFSLLGNDCYDMGIVTIKRK